MMTGCTPMRKPLNDQFHNSTTMQLWCWWLKTAIIIYVLMVSVSIQKVWVNLKWWISNLVVMTGGTIRRFLPAVWREKWRASWIHIRLLLVVQPPLWKIWTSIGMTRNPIYGQIKHGNQTTNQMLLFIDLLYTIVYQYLGDFLGQHC